MNRIRVCGINWIWTSFLFNKHFHIYIFSKGFRNERERMIFFLSGAGNIFILRGKKSLILNNFKTKILIKSIIILS